MRRTFTTTILILAYLALWLKPMYPYIQFELNKEYIIKTLCVERNKEVNTCQGECHLKKEIDKNTGNEKPYAIPDQITENEIFILCLYGFDSELSGTKDYLHSTYIMNYRFLMEKSHFHPPKLA